MKTEFYINLLNEIQEFENSEFCKPNSSVEDFRGWMNNKKYVSESPTKLMNNENHQVSFLDNEICKQVLLLGRYSKQLIRKSLSDFPEIANEEFTYLYRLKDEPLLTKIQLTEKNGHEKQTGMQILKRLLDHGLIEEHSDEEDRRIKKLTLTDKGQELFHSSVHQVDMTSKILCGKLNENEKKTLLEILLKLNDFHSHLHSEHKNSDISQIQQFFL
ncbi:MarR family transcriptional regulator [Chryseobacterium sp. Leaf180]|uniref:MarR family winged helix-turn-helix transcriptional regulator n=1 Tax=Chryseobacterium sp. Leaf180 TaxID=1736289 RepID=UPI0006F84DC7|nr:MarR family winged helix-turn-helix transcriptional regulator [Chryseobacterium sp. Leaf180]KQR94821.1 MarR family transcriptional regulator [Chryseobacterium sp. Leaf180]